MADFPVLNSGAVAQYPIAASSGRAVRVVRFLDGSDQRYPLQGRSLRQWQIQLALLNEGEIHQIEVFFKSVQGDYSSFSFPDPLSGELVPNCRLASPSLVSEYLGVDNNTTSFWVIETYG